jgi:glycosyltransferase involved in cell wall biosynthesis
MAESPDFSIVTPSLDMGGYLRRCVRSVADQEGVTLEHLVMDGGSTDGTVEWLEGRTDVVCHSEPDDGMYDAIGRGFDLSRGEILAWLNCDEQYLPGTLAHVRAYFAENPDIDIVFGGALLIRPDGSLISYRKAQPPRWHYVLASHLYVLSCTMFVRAEVIRSGSRFDPSFRVAGDADFVVRVLRRGHRPGWLRRYLSAFTMTGQNLCATDRATEEARALLEAGPRWVRASRLPLNGLRLLEKWAAGAYRQKMPLVYSVYGADDARARREFTATEASFRWRAA